VVLTVEGWTDTTTGQGVAYVNLTALSDPGFDDLRLHVAVFEDDFGPWNGGNGVKQHHWNTRELLTGADGQALTLASGDSEALTLTFDASSYAQDLDQVGVIAFLQSSGATREVVQAAYMKEHIATPVNHLPEFASPGVTPETGNTSTTFRFEVGYRDEDDDRPVRAQVVIDDVAYDLRVDHPDGPFTDWIGFYHETPLTVGEHTYRFVFSDGTAELRIPDPTTGGPVVFEGPTVEPPTSAPTLALPSIHPVEGDALTLRTFSVVYTDGEGDAPTEATLVIDGVPYEMTGQGTDYGLGVTYTFSTVLAPGDHEYHFSFGDGVHGVRLPATAETVESVVEDLQRIVVLASHAEDGEVVLGESVTYGFDDGGVPDDLITSYLWESDRDGVLGREDEVTFTPTEGDHEVTLTVGTSGGAEYSTKVHLLTARGSTEPVIDDVTVSPEVPTEGDDVSVSVRVLNEGNVPTDILDVELLDADGGTLALTSLSGPVSPGANATAVLVWTAEEGTHTLTVRVANDTYLLPLLVEENFPPFVDVSIEGGDDSILEGEEVTFSVQVSDAENDDVAYRWDFGDGATSDEASPSHEYSKAGRYTVSVTVTDQRGGETTDTMDVQVREASTPGLGLFAILLVLVVSALMAIALRKR
jgi:PKD repeat protein